MLDTSPPTETIELLNPSFEEFKKAHEGITTANPKLLFKAEIKGKTFERAVQWHGFPLNHKEKRNQDISDQWEAHQASLERTKRRIAA
jgi:hypothetical protein